MRVEIEDQRREREGDADLMIRRADAVEHAADERHAVHESLITADEKAGGDAEAAEQLLVGEDAGEEERLGDDQPEDDQ